MLMSTGTKLYLGLGAVLLLCALCVWGLVSLSSWHSAQLETSYKQGYSAAQKEYAQEALRRSVQGVQSAREARGTQEKHVQVVRKKANAAQKAIPSGTCALSGTDIGLLNSTIEAGNAGLRVHGSSDVPRTREVQ